MPRISLSWPTRGSWTHRGTWLFSPLSGAKEQSSGAVLSRPSKADPAGIAVSGAIGTPPGCQDSYSGPCKPLMPHYSPVSTLTLVLIWGPFLGHWMVVRISPGLLLQTMSSSPLSSLLGLSSLFWRPHCGVPRLLLPELLRDWMRWVTAWPPAVSPGSPSLLFFSGRGIPPSNAQEAGTQPIIFSWAKTRGSSIPGLEVPGQPGATVN